MKHHKKNPNISIVMITYNESHNLKRCLDNICDWASQVFIVDSYSSDDTVRIAKAYGAYVHKREFQNFGDQWNFAVKSLPIKTKWTMKLDPDEILSTDVKKNIDDLIQKDLCDGIEINRRLWFMGKILPVNQKLLRVWKTGLCEFSNVTVNEYPIVSGLILSVPGIVEHHDSPNLDHWINKQNLYTTLEAERVFEKGQLAIPPKFFGSSIERRMWLKKNFWRFPFRYLMLFIYHYFLLGAFKAGKEGLIWAHLRTEVYRIWEYKNFEMKKNGPYLTTKKTVK
jgi:glycosyltransferase involved in cell wall biosynthesis